MRRPQRTLERWSARCGRPLTILLPGGEQKSCYGFLQPLRYKNKIYLDNDYLPGGFSESGHFLYLGPPSLRLDRQNGMVRIQDEEQTYVVKRAECVYRGKDPFYIWAVLRLYTEEAAYD